MIQNITFLLLFFATTVTWSQEEIELVNFPDTEAQFIGGATELQRYIIESLQYPLEAIEKNIQGKVYASFIVRKDGSIAEVKIEKGVHPLLDQETIRVLNNMPNWTPGEVEGKPVNVRCRIPIEYSLDLGDEEDEEEKEVKKKKWWKRK